MSDERRKKPCYWETPRDFSQVRLKPEGPALDTHKDEDGSLYVIDEDGERTYLIFS